MTLSSGEPSAVGGRHRVVIIGSGFGGLNAAKALKRADVDITLISKTTTHLFQPLLYQVATGILSEGDIAPTTRLILRRQKNVRVLLGEVNAIDLKAQTVTSKLMDMTTVTPYDSLIVAAGAQQSYFGNDEFATFAPANEDHRRRAGAARPHPGRVRGRRGQHRPCRTGAAPDVRRRRRWADRRRGGWADRRARRAHPGRRV